MTKKYDKQLIDNISNFTDKQKIYALKSLKIQIETRKLKVSKLQKVDSIIAIIPCIYLIIMLISFFISKTIFSVLLLNSFLLIPLILYIWQAICHTVIGNKNNTIFQGIFAVMHILNIGIFIFSIIKFDINIYKGMLYAIMGISALLGISFFEMSCKCSVDFHYEENKLNKLTQRFEEQNQFV